jgi:cytochrome P450 family 142 subfamily A polypeptide 1
VANHPVHPEIRLVDGAFYGNDPHPHLTWMRANAPVYRDEAGQVWGITLYEDILAISKDPKTFCNGQGMRPDAPSMPFMINLDDPLHRKRRAIVNKGFTPRQVSGREERIRQICIDLIERVRARGEFDFVMDLAAWLPLIVIGDMLGVMPDHYADLLRWSDDMVRASGATDEAVLNRGNDSFLEYHTYQMQVIADRRLRSPQKDLVSLLVHADMDGEKLSDDDILWESLLILVGGDETTRHVISGGMDQLLRNPGELERLRADRSLLPSAAEEMIRWVTPIQNMARTVTEDVVVRGQQLRAGDKLLLLYPSANRDERVFAEPFRFDVGRTPNEHLAFGHGAHFCLGASLARLEVRMFFEELLARMPRLELVDDRPPRLRPSNFISGIEEMRVRVA